MSAVAVVCPHCGARQPDRDPIAAAEHRRGTTRDGVAVDPYRGEPAAPPEPEPATPDGPTSREPLRLSGDEARALLEVKGVAHAAVAYERPPGPMVLILPRAEAAGLTRTLEWVLTFVALPMIVLGVAPMFLRPRLWRVIADGNEWALTLLSGVVGSITLWVFADEVFPLSEAATWGLVASCGGALIGRAIFRSLPPRRL